MRPLRGRPLALLHSPGPAGLHPWSGSEAPSPHASGHPEPFQQPLSKLRPLPCQRSPVAELLPPLRGACHGKEVTSGRVAGLGISFPSLRNASRHHHGARAMGVGRAPGLGVRGEGSGEGDEGMRWTWSSHQTGRGPEPHPSLAFEPSHPALDSSPAPPRFP